MDITDGVLKAAGIVLGPMTVWIRRRTRHWRAARYLARHLPPGIRVNRKVLRALLRSEDIENLVFSEVSADVESAVHRLGPIVTGGTWPSGGPSVAELIRRGYLSSLTTSEVLTGISGQIAAVAERITLPVAGAMDSDLLRLNPTLAADARRLSEGVPAIAIAVGALVRADSRADLLRAWSAQHPAWLPEQGDLYGWLGEAAADVDETEAAVKWFDLAVEYGASDRGYWRVRKFWASKSKDEAAAIAYFSPDATHTLVEIVSAGLGLDARLEKLGAWNPSTKAQAALRAQLTVQFKRDADRLEEAIEDGLRWWEDDHFSGAAVVAAEALLRRSSMKGTSKANDLGRALSLSLEVRDARRRWGSSSGVAVSHAMHAYMLLMDPDRAWLLSQIEPVGEATPSEAAHEDVREAMVILLAERGSVEAAMNSLDENFSEAAKLQVRAREAELLLDDQRANDLWSQAIAATDDWNDKAVLCIRLATRGVIDPFVAELRNDNPEIATEIVLIGDLFAEKSGSEQRAREAALTNSRVAHLLVTFLAQRERHEDLVFVAEKAAETWDDPDDWFKAARSHQILGRSDLAKDRAYKALQLASADWGDRFAALGLLVEIDYQSEDWGSAAQHAASMVQMRPNNSSARWALIIMKYHGGAREEAFEAWSASPVPLVPRDQVQASVWFSLFRVYGSEMGTVDEALSIARDFITDEQVRNLAAGALLMGPITEEPDSRVADFLADIERQFPDSHGFTRLELPDTDDPEELLAKLDEMSGGPRDYSAIEDGLTAGTLPIGLASKVANRSLVETLILRTNSPRYVGPIDAATELPAVEAAAGKLVVIDATALVTLATLPDEIAGVLYAAFAGGRTSTRQLLDANASKESLARPSGGRFIPSGPDRPPQFVLDDPDERAQMSALAERVVDWFRRTQRVPTAPPAPGLEVLEDARGRWSVGIDIALANGQAFWCDDRATRQLAAHAGVQTFGTTSVVEYLRSSGAFSEELADSIEASLIIRWAIGVPYRFSSYALALVLNNYSPKGVAAALINSGPEDIQLKLTQITMAMGKTSDPQWVESWADAGAQYVRRVSLAGQESSNAAIYMSNVLRRTWITPTTIPFVAAGIKRATGSDWPGILQGSIRRHMDFLESKTSAALARQYVLGLVAQIPEEDHALVLEVVLER